MTPNQIADMVDRIVALFPTSTIGRNTVKTGWQQDDFLLAQSVEDGRKVITVLRDSYERFPTLKEVHRCFLRVQRGSSAEGDSDPPKCSQCQGNLWLDGRTDDNPQGYTQVLHGRVYTAVIPCPCTGRQLK